jgi:hypothetical protein
VATVTSVKLVSCSGAETEIITYFDTIPKVYDPTDATLSRYIKYNGDTLKYLLPYGNYYVKIGNGTIEYYSDWIRISNLYPNLITSWTNSGFETLTTSGTTIVSAIRTAGNDSARSGTFHVRKGEQIKVIFFLTLNSGDEPSVYLINSGWTLSDNEQADEGINEITLTATWTGDAQIAFYATANVNFITSEVFVIRDFSSKFCRVDFSNTDNFGDLLYEDSFSQTVWLKAILNSPTHEMVNTGEEKDGIFIAEKIVSKYVYSLIAYVSRGLYNCLMRLPQHDTITITDEVGNVYYPKIGNVTVEPAEWVSFDTCKITIKFNNDSLSNFSWVK